MIGFAELKVREIRIQKMNWANCYIIPFFLVKAFGLSLGAA